ncbi:MAG: LPS assembly protein LptD, partial [Sphingomonadales bacterium]|nr:LPS assembly protein LptD [Sphingomonadales bacterium]
SVNEAELADDPAFAGINGTDGRFLPQLSLRLNWPFIQVGKDHSQIIEPIVDIIGAPQQTPSDAIPLEDSRTFELSDSNIYSDNRFPGIDRYEGGTRINYGVRWQLNSGRFNSEVFVAQSYRLSNEESFFGAGSGLEGKFSDIVGRIEASVDDSARIIYRFRIDKDDAAFRRNEVDAVFGKGDNLLSVGYYKLNRGTDFIGLEDREEIRVAASYEVKDSWTVYGDVIRNLTNGYEPIAHQLGLRYRDECLEFSLAWKKSFTTDRDILPGNSIMFRINLKHLG